MELIIKRERDLLKTLWLSLFVMGVAFSMVVVVYGMDSIVTGAHDAFHDFRHVIGMPCH
ncbi:MAG: CbtB-domain containing protein [Nitrospinae bacterium]|nr:CbtB-domain containing protein [Nitrospinota bacterium]